MPDFIAGHRPYRNGYQAIVSQPQPQPPAAGPPTPPPMPMPMPRPMPRPMPVPPILPPGMPPVPQPRRSRRSTAVALAAVASAFLVAAGVFAALFVSAAGDHTAEADRLDQRRAEVTDLDGRVAAADAQQRQAERTNDKLETENTELAPCVDAMRTYMWEARTDAERKTALNDVVTFCQ